MTTTFIGLSRDHSMSMSPITGAAKNDYNTLINALKQAQTETPDSDVRVSVITCGGPSSYAEVKTVSLNVPIQDIQPITTYKADGGGTPLRDSILATIEALTKSAVEIGHEADSKFVVMVTTDGEENSSRNIDKTALKQLIQQRTALGNWTFIARVPRDRTSVKNAQELGFPPDNILVWDTTEKGQTIAAAATTQAFTSFMSSGNLSTTKFFANLEDVTIEEVQAQLVDISSEVEWLTVQSNEAGMQIRDFVEGKTGKPLLKGSAFYELIKSTLKVQDYKLIAIRHKQTGAVYTGPAARQLLALPRIGTVKLVPDELGDFEVFIQSTSVNRKVDSGTKIMIWENVGVKFKEGPSAR